MIINKPLEIKDKEKLIEALSKLSFIEIELVRDEAIIKKKLSGRFIKLRQFLGFNWVGQITKGKDKFYIWSLKSFYNLDTWEEIKQVMEIIERYQELEDKLINGKNN